MWSSDCRIESAEAPAWKPDGQECRHGDERRGDNERRVGNTERAPRQGHEPGEDELGKAKAAPGGTSAMKAGGRFNSSCG